MLPLDARYEEISSKIRSQSRQQIAMQRIKREKKEVKKPMPFSFLKRLIEEQKALAFLKKKKYLE